MILKPVLISPYATMRDHCKEREYFFCSPLCHCLMKRWRLWSVILVSSIQCLWFLKGRENLTPIFFLYESFLLKTSPFLCASSPWSLIILISAQSMSSFIIALWLFVIQYYRDNIVMHCVTTLQSTMDHMYDGGPMKS